MTKKKIIGIIFRWASSATVVRACQNCPGDNSSSMFEIKRNRDTNLNKAKIQSAEEVASSLQKQGTLDPTYREKLESYKKNKKTKGTIY